MSLVENEKKVSVETINFILSYSMSFHELAGCRGGIVYQSVVSGGYAKTDVATQHDHFPANRRRQNVHCINDNPTNGEGSAKVSRIDILK